MRYSKWFFYVTVFFTILAFQSFTTDGKLEEKINFKDLQWRFICREAVASKKLIFVYIGADYCSACRRMDTELKSKKIGAFYNQNFISAKFDATDLIQHQRAVSWGVNSVPTLVFLNEKREVIYSVTGFKDHNALIAEAQIALAKSGILPQQQDSPQQDNEEIETLEDPGEYEYPQETKN